MHFKQCAPEQFFCGNGQIVYQKIAEINIIFNSKKKEPLM